MAKPICVIYIPKDCSLSPSEILVDRIEMTAELERNKPDYHWFVLPSDTLTDVSFDVFHEKDFKDTEELRKIINEYTSK
jgi:hypothetical protein